MILVLSGIDPARIRPAIEWSVVILGAGKALAPWLFGFSAHDAATWLHVVLGGDGHGVRRGASPIREGIMSTCPSAALRAALLTGAGVQAAYATDAARGWALAMQLCSRCHIIGREQEAGGFVGPSSVGIANMPSTTGIALSVFLQSHHQRMLSLRLERDERDAIIDYILSLKAGQRATR